MRALKCVLRAQRGGSVREAQYGAVAWNVDAVVSLCVSLFVFILVSPVTRYHLLGLVSLFTMQIFTLYGNLLHSLSLRTCLCACQVERRLCLWRVECWICTSNYVNRLTCASQHQCCALKLYQGIWSGSVIMFRERQRGLWASRCAHGVIISLVANFVEVAQKWKSTAGKEQFSSLLSLHYLLHVSIELKLKTIKYM